ncbi:MAG: hypothetical protein QM758_27730 [Armatimonas sp.]
MTTILRKGRIRTSPGNLADHWGGAIAFPARAHAFVRLPIVCPVRSSKCGGGHGSARMLRTMSIRL